MSGGKSRKRTHHDIALSSTFRDLKQHREAVLDAMSKLGLSPLAMENDSARPEDLIESSLSLIKAADAYIGIVGYRYGQIPECPIRNPHHFSITELEYEEAIKKGLPICMFVMSNNHLVPMGEVVVGEDRRRREAFCGRIAKTHIYAEFDSVDDLKTKVTYSLVDLRERLDARFTRTLTESSETDIPVAPALFAMPPYTPGHVFIGRLKEIQLLSDWAAKQGQPVLVLEAIGGMGKSMVCWQWVNHYSRNVRQDWAGIFWYSFYERGADMNDFCSYALAYVSGRPVKQFKGSKTESMANELIQYLRQHPWLLVLDGLERILVAYNRYDAAQLRDEEVETSKGALFRDRAETCIREADTKLLRTLTEASPSKFLISSRLMPSALLNISGTERPGVVHEVLVGLDPADALAMLRALGIAGNSFHVQRYLDKNFGCHPLVVGVVGGLIRNYPPAPRDFDRWVEDPIAGGPVNLAEMDLVQRRNHILTTAFNDLTPDERILLTRIALVSEAVDYQTLIFLSPRYPDLPKKVEPPPDWWQQNKERKRDYEAVKLKYEQYQREMEAWHKSALQAERWLRISLENLGSRGLLQWDREHARYDLHPVVRGYAVSSIAPEQRPGVAQKVVDHFSSRSHFQYDNATSINDLRDPLQVARTLLYIGKIQQASTMILRLVNSLFWNLEAYAEYLALVQPLFPYGWTQKPLVFYEDDLSKMWTFVAIALEYAKNFEDADWIYQHVIEMDIHLDRPLWVLTDLRNLAMLRADCGHLRSAGRINDLLSQVTEVLGDEEYLALERLWRFRFSVQCGNFVEAKTCWAQFTELPRPRTRNIYRPGNAEYYFALFCFYQNQLNEKVLEQSETRAQYGNNRLRLRDLHRLRGEWKMSLTKWAEAAVAFEEEIRMSREAGVDTSESEARLALAHVHQGQLQAVRETADRLSQLPTAPHLELAELYLALGEHSKARAHVLPAYRSAWADGPPYSFWWNLRRCRKVIKTLGDHEPRLPSFDPSNDEALLFAANLLAYVGMKREQLQAEEARKRRRF